MESSRFDTIAERRLSRRSALATRSFDGASLFIDDCANGDVLCVNSTNGTTATLVSTLSAASYCWDSTDLCCRPCDGMVYWSQQCYYQLPDFCA